MSEKILNPTNAGQEKNIEEKEYKFQYLTSAGKYLDRWEYIFPEFSKTGRVMYFYPFLCPVSTVNVHFRERTRTDYDTIEYFVLRLYASSVTSPETIADLLAIDLNYVKNIIGLMENSYGHIENGGLTEKGKQSLDDGQNIQVYETTTQVQFESITGTLLRYELWQEMSAIEPYYFQRNPDRYKRFLPIEAIERDITEELTGYLEAELQRYKEKEMIDRNLEEVIGAEVSKLTYTEAFMIRYDFLPHPFILFPVTSGGRLFWNPVAISTSNADIMTRKGLSFKVGKKDLSPVILADSMFESLLEIEAKHELTVSKAPVGSKFTLGKERREYEVTEKGAEGARRFMHPMYNHLPVFAKLCTDEMKEEGVVTENVDLQLSDKE